MPLDQETKEKLDTLRGDPLEQSVNHAVRMGAPDQNAKVIDLARSQQLPVDTVQRNLPEVDARHHIDKINVGDIRANYPTLADYLRDPENAAVSLDDLDNLKGVETALKEPDVALVPNIIKAMGSRSNKLIGDLIEFRGTLNDEYRKSSLPGIQFGENGYEWHWDLPYNGPSVMSILGDRISEGESYRLGYQPDFTWEKFKGDMTPTNAAGYIAEQGPQSLVDMMATIYALPAYILSRDQDIAETRAANDAREDADMGDLVNSFVVATGVSLLERIGAKSVFDVGDVRTLKEGAQAASEAFVKEAATEFVQEGFEYYGETVGTRTSVSHADAFDRALAGAFVGGPFGGAIRATTATAQGISNRVNRQTIQRGESMRDQAVLDEIIMLAQSSKTNERAQDRFKQFLRGAGRERAVHISAKDVIELESQGESIPEYVLNEAMQNVDGEIAIPLEDFVIDPEMVQVLRPYVRFAPDQLNSTELDQFQTETVEEMIERATQQADIRTEIDEIYDLVKEQLVVSGRENELTAKWKSKLIQEYIATKVLDTGLTPREVYERMNFNVVGPRSVPPAPDAQVLEQARESGYEGESKGEAAEWVRAVAKGLDMSTEARMQRAKDMGFDTDQVWYHGTESDFESFEVFSGLAGEGIYFSTQHTANVYGEQGSVIPVYVLGKKATPQDVKRVRDEIGSNWNNDLINQQLKTEGFAYRDAKTPDIVVFDPSNIRSVNAAFDPDYADSANLLAQAPTLHQAQRNNVGLYSQVEKVVESMRLPEWKKDGAASGRVVWEKISKSDGVKQEELKWLGLEEFLDPYKDVDFRNVEVRTRDDGKVQVRYSIEDYEFSTTETIDETGETVEITDSARSYTRRLSKDIEMIQKLIQCMTS